MKKVTNILTDKPLFGIVSPIIAAGLPWIDFIPWIITVVGGIVGIAVGIMTYRKQRAEKIKEELEAKKLQLEIEALKQHQNESTHISSKDKGTS